MQETKSKMATEPKVKEAVEAASVERHSWNSEDECGAFMANLIKMNKCMTVLEIGVFEGETSQHLINALPQGGQYVGVDVVDYRTQKTIETMNTGGKSIDFILGSSLDEMPKMPHHHFDLIFIDSIHEFDHVLQEFKLAEYLISKDGLIILHDTIHLEGPKQLVAYATYYNYNAITLNTTEGRGISILKR
jgi:predicted O-methyltransferase YrrM